MRANEAQRAIIAYIKDKCPTAAQVPSPQSDRPNYWLKVPFKTRARGEFTINVFINEDDIHFESYHRPFLIVEYSNPRLFELINDYLR